MHLSELLNTLATKQGTTVAELIDQDPNLSKFSPEDRAELVRIAHELAQGTITAADLRDPLVRPYP